MRMEVDIRPAGRYTVAAAAEALGVSRKTITRWRESGELRGEVGRNGRYSFKGINLIRIYNTR